MAVRSTYFDNGAVLLLPSHLLQKFYRLLDDVEYFEERNFYCEVFCPAVGYSEPLKMDKAAPPPPCTLFTGGSPSPFLNEISVHIIFYYLIFN